MKDLDGSVIFLRRAPVGDERRGQPIGALAFRNTKEFLEVAYSLLNDCDRWDRNRAREIALGRLRTHRSGRIFLLPPITGMVRGHEVLRRFLNEFDVARSERELDSPSTGFSRMLETMREMLERSDERFRRQHENA
jgi:hypothetical protein